MKMAKKKKRGYRPQKSVSELPSVPIKSFFTLPEFSHYSGVSERRLRTLAGEGRIGHRKKNLKGEETKRWQFTREELVKFRRTKRESGRKGIKRVQEKKQ